MSDKSYSYSVHININEGTLRPKKLVTYVMKFQDGKKKFWTKVLTRLRTMNELRMTRQVKSESRMMQVEPSGIGCTMAGLVPLTRGLTAAAPVTAKNRCVKGMAEKRSLGPLFSSNVGLDVMGLGV